MTVPANHRVALITGAAARLGAATARLLHSKGYRVVIHYHHSVDEANTLCDELNDQRQDSAAIVQADLCVINEVTTLGETAIATWGRLDVLVNNASTFYPTALAGISEADWDTLFASNAKAPLFLAKVLAEALKKQKGCIINMSDLYARRGLTNHSIYTMAKAALEGLTRTLARELAPDVRVNSIAPGAILWPPDDNLTDDKKDTIIAKSALQRMGSAEDIANAVLFLVEQGTYITGQVIHVDGGR